LPGAHDRYDTDAQTIEPSSARPCFMRKLARFDRPTAALKWQIIPDVDGAVSYGTGFLPRPSINWRPTPASTIAASLLNYVDPRRGNEPVTGTLTTIVRQP